MPAISWKYSCGEPVGRSADSQASAPQPVAPSVPLDAATDYSSFAKPSSRSDESDEWKWKIGLDGMFESTKMLEHSELARASGVRGGLAIDRKLSGRWALHLSGLVGYASQTKLDYDVGAELAAWAVPQIENHVLFGIAGLLVAGFDEWGVGEMRPAMGPGTYIGVGARIGGGLDKTRVNFDSTIALRTINTNDPQANNYPPHELKLRLDVRFGENRINGVFGEFLGVGDLSLNFFLGVHVRLR